MLFRYKAQWEGSQQTAGLEDPGRWADIGALLHSGLARGVTQSCPGSQQSLGFLTLVTGEGEFWT